ncbi:MAG: glycosyltransferase family A protein [Flavobacteriales bacterium]|nr:glycosyltransferase family A protein [Flavobacteriales bacterium]
MNKKITFGYAVSTVESKLLDNVDFIDQLAKINDPIVIVNQFQDRPLDASPLGHNVQVINSKSRGLSQSRNIALKAIDVDFVMICDDDILLVPENIERVKKEIQKNPDAALYFTRLQKASGELWRENYEGDAFSINSLSFNSKRRIQRINSMEQVYNLRFLQANQLVFNIDFGVGSGKFQLGEETLMSWSILKSGGVLRYLPIVARIHPPLSSGSIFSAQNAKAVFAVHRKVFGLTGLITFSGFLLKSLLRFLSQRIK